MIYVVAKKIVKKENQAAFMAVAQEMIDCTRKEDGCIEYTLAASRTDENLLVFVERWESRAHLDAHSKTEHFLTLGPKYNAFCDGTELMILEDAYELAAQ